MPSTLAGGLKNFFTDPNTGDLDWRKILSYGAGAVGIAKALSATDNLEGLKGFLGLDDQNKAPMGYMGGIPRYTVSREQVPNTYDPNRRPGSGGQRYFTNTQYVPQGDDEGAFATAMSKAQADAGTQASALEKMNLNNPARQNRPVYGQTDAQIQQRFKDISGKMGPRFSGKDAQYEFMDYANRYGVGLGQLAEASGTPLRTIQEQVKKMSGLATPRATEPQTSFTNPFLINAAGGGLMSLPSTKGYYLGGTTNGMADMIPASINGSQPAALSDGEFVIPADVVSAIGGGNSNAGAKQFYNMMDRVRQQAYGRKGQIKPVDLNKTFPA